MKRILGITSWIRRCRASRRVRYCIAMSALLAVLASVAGWWLLPPLEPAPYTTVSASGQLLDREGGRLYVALSKEETWSLPQGDAGFSDYLKQATVAAEDQRFYTHIGVDPVAVARAVGQNLREGGVASGASTLSMQLVKLGGHNSASLRGKAGQALKALRLEKSLGKDEILEAYLNRAPYGMNLVGAEAAAWRYFGKTAKTLSLPEAALLAGLPKAPSRLNPISHPERARSRRDYVLRRMFAEGIIDSSALERALAAPVRAKWHEFPRSAPHLGVPYKEALARGDRVTLTLDGRLQRELEARLPHYLKRFNGNITNGAILVVDVATGAVLARVASADFYGTPGGGQVDGCWAIRSPGSTLKPFLFGLAMTRQQLYPTEVLLDDVLDYGRYAPGNFDGIFNGPVTATESLRYSLNVPAVALLARVGVGEFQGFLRSAGLESVDRSAEDYGLGLALGNCEVSLESLAALYLSVASLGRKNALHLDGEGETGEKLFDPSVARLLYDMLEQPFPEEQGRGLLSRDGNEDPVCWKTGTSTGYHDAWTFAFNQHYLVGVWLGNNDGRGARQLVGAYAALPLVRDVFRGLPAKSGDAWPASPEGTRVSICSASGLPAEGSCGKTHDVVLPTSLWRHRRCTLHSASQVGHTVLAARPSSATAWNLASLEPNSASSDASSSLPELSLVSPAQGASYLISGVQGGDRIALRVSGGERGTAHWFMDGRYLGSGDETDSIHWALEPGEHKVTVQMEDGRRETSTFTVLTPGEVDASS